MYETYQKLLDQNGLKNSDISKATGISNMTLSDWKHGKTHPKTKTLQTIADYFHVSVDYLLYGEEFSDENAKLTSLIRNDAELSKALSKYAKMTDGKKKLVVKYINMLSEE
jgi:repressor LexA